MENTSLVLSYLPIEEEQQLFGALHQALINDSTNLYKLQKLFYPPGEVSPDTVVLNLKVTVNTISNPDNKYCYSSAFVKSRNYYVRSNFVDRFSVSNDAFSTTLTAYINSFKGALEVNGRTHFMY